MDYLLSGLGIGLSRPVVRRLPGATLTRALSDARDMLSQHPACETIEVFADDRFLLEVGSSASAAPLPDAEADAAPNSH